MGTQIDDEQSCNIQAEEIMVTIVFKEWGLGAASVRKTAVMTLKRITPCLEASPTNNTTAEGGVS
jgi:hypothetical protein